VTSVRTENASGARSGLPDGQRTEAGSALADVRARCGKFGLARL